jgi:hypothetical protein
MPRGVHLTAGPRVWSPGVMTTPQRRALGALLVCFLWFAARNLAIAGTAATTTTTTLPACAGRPAKILACEAAQTKLRVCQPCDGTALKGCGRKVGPLFKAVKQAAGTAIKAVGKGRTRKVAKNVARAQRLLDKITRAADKLIDKIQGTQSCKDAAHTAIGELRADILALTMSTTTSTTTTTRPTDIPNTANSITATAGGPRSDPEGVAPPAANTVLITWKDARGADRKMTLGAYLYQYDFSFNDNTQDISRSANDDAYGHEGFGYLVSHNTQTDNSPLGKASAPTSVQTAVFAGGHHAIHHIELFYDRDTEGGGLGIKIPAVIEWLVATGRDHPIWSVTWKAGQAVNPGPTDFDTYRMDVRGPYGSLNFDGAATRGDGDAIGGVAWGDYGLMFTTTSAPLTLNSTWTYNTPNSVNFSEAWTETTNAEMGIVETRTGDKEMGYPDRVYGRERGETSASAYPNKQDCSGFSDARTYVVPCVSGWPYQLMNYDWDPSVAKPAGEATGTKLVAWGSPYGWLGASNSDLFDFSGTVDARGDRALATFIVLGPHCRLSGGMCNQPGDVALAIETVEAFAAATIGNVTAGAVATQVPKGPGASEMKTLTNGYNDTYAAWYLSADANQVAFTFTPAGGHAVKTPIFVVQNYTGTQLPKINVGGVAVTVNTGAATSGAFVSLNAGTNELWVTLNQTVNAAIDVQIMP